MQKLIGLVRRCVEDYRMIEAGDRIGVGVSGGKDSLALLVFGRSVTSTTGSQRGCEVLLFRRYLSRSFSAFVPLPLKKIAPFGVFPVSFRKTFAIITTFDLLFRTLWRKIYGEKFSTL